jgi:hypothetical protein
MKAIIVLVLVCISVPLFAKEPEKKINVSATQSTPPTSFLFIRGHKQGKNQAVTWGMNNNSGITHFIVERTYEDPYDPNSVWQTVGIVPSTPLSPIFKLIDTPVLPGTLNYRVIAVMNNNTTIISDLYTIYIQ